MATVMPLTARERFGEDTMGLNLATAANWQWRALDGTATSWDPSDTARDAMSDVSAEEIASYTPDDAGGDGYTQGAGTSNGALEGVNSVTYGPDATNDRVEWDAQDVTFGADTGGPTAIRWLLLVVKAAAFADAWIVAAADAGGNKSVAGGDLVWLLDAEGLFYN